MALDLDGGVGVVPLVFGIGVFTLPSSFVCDLGLAGVLTSVRERSFGSFSLKKLTNPDFVRRGELVHPGVTGSFSLFLLDGATTVVFRLGVPALLTLSLFLRLGLAMAVSLLRSLIMGLSAIGDVLAWIAFGVFRGAGVMKMESTTGDGNCRGVPSGCSSCHLGS